MPLCVYGTTVWSRVLEFRFLPLRVNSYLKGQHPTHKPLWTRVTYQTFGNMAGMIGVTLETTLLALRVLG